MHEDNYLIAVSHLHNDQTDGNLLKDQTEDTLILKFIYGNILELKSKLKLSNMFAYGKLISLHIRAIKPISRAHIMPTCWSYWQLEISKKYLCKFQ